MNNLDTKLRVIELRAQGNSLNAIAKLVGVRRQTVADWLIDCAEEVDNLKAMELDALLEAFLISKRKRLEQLTARLEQIRAEIDKRGFADVPTEKLLELEEDARKALENECSRACIRSEQELKKAKVDRISPLHSSLILGLDDEPFSEARQIMIDTTPLVIEPKSRGNGQKRAPADG
jgi:DNA-binding transcriptional MerR regulator